jgi:divalent metal cation (Fe/Co/Zn/Cd) transporter
VRDLAARHPHVHEVIEVLTVQQGPGEVVVATRLCFAPDLTSREVSEAIRDLEGALRRECPEAR